MELKGKDAENFINKAHIAETAKMTLTKAYTDIYGKDNIEEYALSGAEYTHLVDCLIKYKKYWKDMGEFVKKSEKDIQDKE